MGERAGLLDGIAVWHRELRRPVHERSPSVIALEAEGAYAEVDAGFFPLAAVLGYAERRHTVWTWREGRPNLERWFASASQRAAFRETLPPPSGI